MRIAEIFQSINGEVTASFQGSLCTFIRMQGCNYSCRYCDTPTSQGRFSGEEMSVDNIYQKILRYSLDTRNVTITGGEPLIQAVELNRLCQFLAHKGFLITLETNGYTKVPEAILRNVFSVAMDVKLDHHEYLAIQNSPDRKRHVDWMKYPICSMEDLSKAIAVKNKIRKLKKNVRHAFSPILPLIPKQLLKWMSQEKQGDVVLNGQIHKLLNVV